MCGRTVDKILVLSGRHQLIYNIEQDIVKTSSEFIRFDHDYSKELLQFSDYDKIYTYLEKIVDIHDGKVYLKYYD